MKRFLIVILLVGFFNVFPLMGKYAPLDSIITSKNIKISWSPLTLPFDTIPQMHYDKYYKEAFDELSQMLEGNLAIDLKRAVYIVENAYLSGNIDYYEFCNKIANEVNKINKFIDGNNLRIYKTCVNAALFEYFTKPNWMNGQKNFSYDVVDPGGVRDITKLFVTKLMQTHTGQCQSLPLYYKILCNELNGEAFIAFCPNHSYIKHIGEDGKWYNIELTTGSFARDDWYIQSMGITTESIKNGVFLTAITDKEEIGYLFVILAETYKFKYADYDYFTLLCAERVLDVLPHNSHAMYLKLQTLQQWGYDYVNIFGQKFSDFIQYISNERNEMRFVLNKIGYTTITCEQYLDNVDKAIEQLGIKENQNWEDFKKNVQHHEN